jgi:hypothetical protein
MDSDSDHEQMDVEDDDKKNVVPDVKAGMKPLQDHLTCTI